MTWLLLFLTHVSFCTWNHLFPTVLRRKKPSAVKFLNWQKFATDKWLRYTDLDDNQNKNYKTNLKRIFIHRSSFEEIQFVRYNCILSGLPSRTHIHLSQNFLSHYTEIYLILNYHGSRIKVLQFEKCSYRYFDVLNLITNFARIVCYGNYLSSATV